MSDQFNDYNDNEQFNNKQSNGEQPSEYSYNEVNDNNQSSNEENSSESQGSVYRYTHVSREDYSNYTQNNQSAEDTYQEESSYNTASNQNSNDYYQEASPSNMPVKRKKNKRKKDHRTMKKVAAVAAAGLIVIGAAGGGAFAGIQYMKDNFVTKDQVATTTNNDQVVLTKSTDTASNSDSSSDTGIKVLDVSNIVQQVKPSIVAITNTLEYTTEISSDPLSQFFGGSGQSQTQTQEAQAYGSGVIIGKTDEALLIVTNNHVTAADSGEESSGLKFYTYSATSKNISVEFNDGTTADAVVQGTDEAMDLAVIQVPLENIQEGTLNNIAVATIGNSDECQEGNGVIAIGNALGEGTSTTVGYISALNRQVTIDGYKRTLLQTDAAINPGNSGGGLFNTKGELIGINSAKYSAEEVEGVGYAIPITSAEEIITELMNQEVRTEVAEEKRGYLGVTVIDISDTYVQNNNYPKGASIQQITEGSPADQAGLNIYDIITAVNGKSVDGKNALRSELNYYEVGETVELTVQHPSGNGFEEKKVSVTLASKDSVTVQEDQTQAN